MKTNQKKRVKKPRNKVKPITKQKVLIVAQELKFARLLAGNEKKSRDRVLKALRKWLVNSFEKKYEFKEDDFIRVWKGLFYAVWMSDKPLVQEELCDNVASILDLFPEDQFHHAVLMIKAALKVLATEWYGIDQHRMDKFLMLVRRLLRASLRTVARSGWSADSCQQYADMLTHGDGLFATKTPIYARNAISLLLHICDCFLEEVAKVSNGELPEGSLPLLLTPFSSYLCAGSELRVAVACRRIFNQLLRQSEAGQSYEDKRRAWEQMGCPKGGPDALELASDSDESDQQSGDENFDDDANETALDPRAGRVDVLLPTLSVPAKEIAELLRSHMKGIQGAARTRATVCAQRFEQLAKDIYPLQVKDTDIDLKSGTPKASKAAKRLVNLERRLVEKSDELALRGLGRKHRKRLLAKSREGISIVEELRTLKKRKNKNSANGNWLVEDAKPITTKTKEVSNKENVNKKSKKRNHSLDEIPSPLKKQKVEEKTNLKEENKNQRKEEKLRIIIKDKQENKEKKLKNAKSDTPKKEKLKITIRDSPNKEKDKEMIKNTKTDKKETPKKTKSVSNSNTPLVVVNKLKNFQKQTSASKKMKKPEDKTPEKSTDTPKKVKFVLKNNSMQGPVDYYKSVRQSPNIPYDSSKRPTKTNLKPNSTPSPINPFFKKKLRLKSK